MNSMNIPSESSQGRCSQMVELQESCFMGKGPLPMQPSLSECRSSE